jgi:hypothetical protein
MKNSKRKIQNKGRSAFGGYYFFSFCTFIFTFLCGCGVLGGSSTRFKVIPVSSRDVATLNSDDVVRVMRRAGFSDEQILELGTQVRNALLQSGAVEIKRGRMIEAIFAVNNNKVFITARLRGNFIYDVEKGSWMGLEVMSGRSKPKEAPPEAIPDKQAQSILPAIPDMQPQSGNILQ